MINRRQLIKVSFTLNMVDNGTAAVGDDNDDDGGGDGIDDVVLHFFKIRMFSSCNFCSTV